MQVQSPAQQNRLNASGYLAEDTIAALACPPGGAVAIVRLSGPKAQSILCTVTSESTKKKTHGLLSRTRIRDWTGQQLDDALVACFYAPRSFTGEDVVEFQIHGSPWIASRLLKTLSIAGARLALPGEFSFRAVRNGKLTLSQAQAIPEVIEARSEQSLKIALDQLGGAQARVFSEVAESLRDLLVLSEAGIDFSDQDLEEISLQRLQAKAAGIREKIQSISATFERGNLLRKGLPVAFLGKPNAGKSSLFNALLGEERAIVSEFPGTTRDLLTETLLLSAQGTSILFRVADAAGLREGREVESIEREGVLRAKQWCAQATILLLVSEPGTSTQDLEALLHLVPKGKTVLGVCTKADRMSQAKEVPQEWKALGIKHWVMTSAQEGWGIDRLCERLVELALPHLGESSDELGITLTREDHWSATQLAIVALNRSIQSESHELFSADLRHALHALSPWIGETVADDILGKIFSEFCIGK
jgi:tRNA modification GTPase